MAVAPSPRWLLLWSHLVLALVPFARVGAAETAIAVYDFNATDIDGNEVSFDKYRGYVLLVVNVASECGLTNNNYRQLNQLYTRLAPEGLRLAAFPCNQFGGQEPGDRATIKEFVSRHNVQFDVYSKVDVNGEDAHPLFKWLKTRLSGSLFIDAIKWNFTKFLLDCYGQPVRRYGPLEEPNDIEADLVAEIEKRSQMLEHLSTNKVQQNKDVNEGHSPHEL